MFTDHAPTQLPDALLTGFFTRDSRLPSDARHTLYPLEAHRPRQTQNALYTAGAIGTLNAFWAQFSSTAGLSLGSNRATGSQFTLVPGKTIRASNALISLGACGSSRAPVAHAAAEALGTWQARVPHVTLPALEASDARGPRRALWAKSPR